MKRCVLFLNGSKEDGKVIAVAHSATLDDILQSASVKLGVSASRLFTHHGGEIDDVGLVRDEDILYVSEGESFISFGEKQEQNRRRDLDAIQCKTSQSSHGLNPGVGHGPTDRRNDGTMHQVDGSPSNDHPHGKDHLHSDGQPHGKDHPHGDVSPRRPASVTSPLPGDWITINVGGKCFTTTRSTLTNKEPESMLARMFAADSVEAQRWRSSLDSSGAFLIDRSPTHFEPLLNFMRHGQLVLEKGVNPLGVLEEARFFGLNSLVEALEEVVQSDMEPTEDSPFNRRDVVQALMTTSTVAELRFQGVNFASANLSKLDLRNINFRFARLSGADLTGANLAHCNMDRADLSKCKMDGATLFGAKMVCATFEGASMKGCNFEDPAGSRTNMEGSNLKGVNLEGSSMANVNLRVANLRHANLQNCDLRSAVLAGADLENCTLSGCDLQEANLRGANLMDVAFDLILTPLHCSQFNNISL